MKWHTIFVDGPNEHLKPSLTVNSAGQFIAFDGKCSGAAAMAACQQLAFEAKKVVLCVGKNIGRFVKQWGPLCSFCGEPDCSCDPVCPKTHKTW